MHENTNPKEISAENASFIISAIESFVNGLDGYESVEVRFFKEYGNLNVTAFIWKKGGIELDDCELVHNVLSAELDKYEDRLPDKYVLNVSSPGLDRPIAGDDDFRRALDTEIEVINTDKQKTHGVLKAYNENEITVTVSGKKAGEVILKKINIAKVQPYIGF